MKVSRSVVLPVPVAEAWRAVSDWETQPRWMRDADTVEVLTDRRTGPGVRIAVRTRVLGIPAFTEVLEVVRWEPPHRLRLAHRSFVRGHGEWTLRSPLAGDPDRTLFTWTEELVPPPPPPPLLPTQLLLRSQPERRHFCCHVSPAPGGVEEGIGSRPVGSMKFAGLSPA